jgi:hypothetical protein
VGQSEGWPVLMRRCGQGLRSRLFIPNPIATQSIT